jgi:SET domain-containing protein
MSTDSFGITENQEQTSELKRYCIVKPSRIHGLGVFAGKNFEKGQVIEECYTLKMDWDEIKNTILSKYVFNYKGNTVSLMLGNGSIYNHSSTPNVEHTWSDDEQTIVEFSAIRNINKGEELFIDYGEEYWEYTDEKEIN